MRPAAPPIRALVALAICALCCAALPAAAAEPFPPDGSPASSAASPGAPPAPPDPALPKEASPDWWATVQRDIQESEYDITMQQAVASTGGAYQAPNRAQNLRTTFTPDGIRVVPREFEGAQPPWTLELQLASVNGQEVEAATLKADGRRLTCARGGLTEWYVNDERGLEQGFTLDTPPGAAGDVAIRLTLKGDLAPSLAAGAAAIEFRTPDGEPVLRYADLAATDATGRTLPARFELDQAALTLHVDTAGAAYPITIDLLTTAPAWTVEGNQAGAKFGWAVGTAGDVNHDGFADVIVGAPGYDSGQATGGGRACLYLGSAQGLRATAAWTATGEGLWAFEFGSSVGTAGDVNGDGYADVIVGSSDAAGVFVYLGNPNGLNANAAWTAHIGQIDFAFHTAVSAAGDMNGDGYDDVIVSMYGNEEFDGMAAIYLGSPNGLGEDASWDMMQLGSSFGASVGTAGDVNGDGYADVIVGAPDYSVGGAPVGAVFVYQGSAHGPASVATIPGTQNGAEFGAAVGTAGDVNADGFSDVIVGAPNFNNGQPGEGVAFVYLGSASGPSLAEPWMRGSTQAGAHYGSSVGTAGDINHDGYADVIVGAPQYSAGEEQEGAAFVYLGSANGPDAQSAPAWEGEGNQPRAGFGFSVGTAGDLNGDGYADLIVGAPYHDQGQAGDAGSASVYLASGIEPSPAGDWTAAGNQFQSAFGVSVGTAGDVNHDGYADVIVGAPWFDHGQSDEGRAYVYLGSARGLGAAADWTTEIDWPGAQFGWSVGTAGDVNHDGYSDVIVGAPYFSNGQAEEGAAFVYLGGAHGLNTSRSWGAETNQAGAHYGWSVGTAGDVDGDGFADIIVGAPDYTGDKTKEGLVFVYRGSANGPTFPPAWVGASSQANASYGYSVGTAGDVNHDGYADVIVGAPWFDHDQSDEGRAYVYLGSAGGLGAAADWTTEINLTGAHYGWSVGTAGDVNHDGYSDVIVGAPYYSDGQAEEGAAFVYLGGAHGLSTSRSWGAETNQAGAHYGWSVGTAGDIDHDGYADITIGAPGGSGKAFIYLGSANGPNTWPSWTAGGVKNEDYFGYSVGTAGDVNHDGYADVIVGAPVYGNGESGDGAAFVYYGHGGWRHRLYLPVIKR